MSRKDGKSTLIDSKERKGVYSKHADDGQTDELQNAAANCPVKIIQVQK
jgi:ferredoxin